ncbi:hypothetical protein BDA96_10G234000 [Sorghum bicolor]|uniref:Uncharacterized protein n=2 Tax=Sorghum bicolor TaxID=4558 RepID=A0A921Q665_SORBI|nr:hypothetical protein BDA96_10G234000 [Sorghum bicolor]KAG0514912.1 hypothetical protein BDA96_10G234000 [Sorghum bicolor]OQU76637.1 hypothetical protein SORBI_3010G177900 [Sorghum bicolor]OQU76638.1 hypothetical protein SORBI_3010G177900 [Sorghum bicolor]
MGDQFYEDVGSGQVVKCHVLVASRWKKEVPICILSSGTHDGSQVISGSQLRGSVNDDIKQSVLSNSLSSPFIGSVTVSTKGNDGDSLHRSSPRPLRAPSYRHTTERHLSPRQHTGGSDGLRRRQPAMVSS